MKVSEKYLKRKRIRDFKENHRFSNQETIPYYIFIGTLTVIAAYVLLVASASFCEEPFILKFTFYLMLSGALYGVDTLVREFARRISH